MVEIQTTEYLAQLLKDKKQLAAFPNVFIHLERILDEGKHVTPDSPTRSPARSHRSLISTLPSSISYLLGSIREPTSLLYLRKEKKFNCALLPSSLFSSGPDIRLAARPPARPPASIEPVFGKANKADQEVTKHEQIHLHNNSSH